MKSIIERRIKAVRTLIDDEWNGTHIVGGASPKSDSVCMMSNDYLDIAKHPDIINKQIQSMRSDKQVGVMSSIFLQEDSVIKSFENDMSNFIGSGTCILCQSGWDANFGLMQSLTNPGITDQDPISEQVNVYIDSMAHTSLWSGCYLGGAQIIPFRHNKPESLLQKITENASGIVVIDSLYSTHGAICPLEDIIEIANTHDCVIVVDESHSLGVFGENGRGLLHALNLTQKVDFVTASLAKAFAGRAGIVACSAEYEDYFKGIALPAVFSSALLPHEVEGLRATLDVIYSADNKRKRLFHNVKRLRAGLINLGFDIGDYQTQIIKMEGGIESNTIQMRDFLNQNNVFGSVFALPATPKDRSLVRFSVNAGHTEKDIDHVISVCDDMIKNRRDIIYSAPNLVKRKNNLALKPTKKTQAA